jgi:hypothetical protein
LDITAIVFGVLGVIGSVASIVALLVSAPTQRERIVHGIYGAVIAVCAGAAIWSAQQLLRSARVERTAAEMLADFDSRMKYTTEGEIEAVLVFLEKNKDLYPIAYSRGQEILQEQKDCLKSRSDVACAMNQVTTASKLKGMLRGMQTTR